MKRLTVLSGIVVLCAGVFLSSANATAPSVRDVPDIKLAPGGPLKGALPSGLSVGATDVYDVLAFAKDFDDAASGLTVSINSIQAIPAPGQGSPSSLTTARVEINGSTQVGGATEAGIDIYGRISTGWVRYTVRVDDASTFVPKGSIGSAANEDEAVAKYSTFELEQPTINSGMASVGDLSTTSRQFSWVWTGETLQMYELDVAINPQSASTALDWVVYVNDLVTSSTSANWDPNGNWLGVSTSYVSHGAAASAGGINYSIDSNGTLTLTSSGSVSEGPWIVGILAANSGDPDDNDGSRILVSSALVPSATFDTFTVGETTTFDDLAAGTIAAATDTELNTSTGGSGFSGGVGPVYSESQIAAGSGWRYEMAAPTDNTVDSVALEIIDLETDTDLPAAALPSALKGVLSAGYAPQIATGNAIKAALTAVGPPIVPRGGGTGNQSKGFRLQSMGFQGVGVGEVVTFSLDVATDAANATDLPQYQIYMTSGFGGTIYGTDVRVLTATVNLAENNNSAVNATRPRINIPTASEGWHRISINFSPGYTVQFFNLDGDNDMDANDLATLATIADSQEAGWDGSDENSVVIAGCQFRGHGQQTATVNVWLDNLSVYRSAYELDLALGAEDLTTAVTPGTELQRLITQNVLNQTSGDLDGSIESYVTTGNIKTDLSAVGISLGYAGGNGPAFDYAAKDFVNGADANVTVDSHDHTNNSSNKSLEVSLAGDDGPDGNGGNWSAIRNGLDTAVVAGSGSGTYVFECYLAKDRVVNDTITNRHPEIRVLLQEVAPNWMGTASGAIYNKGGLPDDVDTSAIPYNWARAVVSMYIPDCENLMGRIHVFDTFQQDASRFNVPIYMDDLKLYRVDDPASFFDADLYDTN
jgi:hypothetical protein